MGSRRLRASPSRSRWCSWIWRDFRMTSLRSEGRRITDLVAGPAVGAVRQGGRHRGMSRGPDERRLVTLWSRRRGKTRPPSQSPTGGPASTRRCRSSPTWPPWRWGSVPGAMAPAWGPVGRRHTSAQHVGIGIAEKPVLLIVDNCEHVISSAAEAIGELLARCHHLQVLATSRELLSIDGEVPIAVAPASLVQVRRRRACSWTAARRLPLVRSGGPRGGHRRDLRATRWSAAGDRAGRGQGPASSPSSR